MTVPTTCGRASRHTASGRRSASQLWVRGELLGGCDIVQTLEEEGSLAASIDDMLNA